MLIVVFNKFQVVSGCYDYSYSITAFHSCSWYSSDCSPYLLVIQSSLHWGSVLHLLGEPAVASTSQMLLLHGGSNAYRSGLLVLQHVSEALEVGGRKREEVKYGDRGYTDEEEQGSTSSHYSYYGCNHPDCVVALLVGTYCISITWQHILFYIWSDI